MGLSLTGVSRKCCYLENVLGTVVSSGGEENGECRHNEQVKESDRLGKKSQVLGESLARVLATPAVLNTLPHVRVRVHEKVTITGSGRHWVSGHGRRRGGHWA